MYSIKALQQHSPGILTILIILLASPLAAEPGVLWRTYHFSPPEYFVLRNQPADTSFEELGTTAEEIDNGYREWERKGEKRIEVLTDYHAVFPLEISRFVPVLLDHDNEDTVFPGMSFTRDLTPEASPKDPHYQEVVIGFGFLGINFDYHYIVYRVPTWYQDGSFSVHWALVHSIDKKHTKLFGSWYVKPLEKNGKPRTYVRNFVQTEMVDPPPFAKSIVTLLGQKNVRDYFDALYRAARTR